MAPWRLDPLVAERLEKNRQQLVEAGGPHEGSADMRVREAAPSLLPLHPEGVSTGICTPPASCLF